MKIISVKDYLKNINRLRKINVLYKEMNPDLFFKIVKKMLLVSGFTKQEVFWCMQESGFFIQKRKEHISQIFKTYFNEKFINDFALSVYEEHIFKFYSNDFSDWMKLDFIIKGFDNKNKHHKFLIFKTLSKDEIQHLNYIFNLSKSDLFLMQVDKFLQWFFSYNYK